jgi:hypothetical protein
LTTFTDHRHSLKHPGPRCRGTTASGPAGVPGRVRGPYKPRALFDNGSIEAAEKLRRGLTPKRCSTTPARPRTTLKSARSRRKRPDQNATPRGGGRLLGGRRGVHTSLQV